MSSWSSRNGVPLMVSSVAAGVAILAVAVAIWTATAQRNDKLCAVLYSLVARSGATIGQPGSPGYAYYHSHPAELAVAKKQNHDFLDALGCVPLNP